MRQSEAGSTWPGAGQAEERTVLPDFGVKDSLHAVWSASVAFVQLKELFVGMFPPMFSWRPLETILL